MFGSRQGCILYGNYSDSRFSVAGTYLTSVSILWIFCLYVLLDYLLLLTHPKREGSKKNCCLVTSACELAEF